MNLLSIGEILWDLIDGTAHLGGAPFNLAVQARRLGHNVAFVSAVGDDELGRAALAEAAARGIPTDFISTVKGTPTGTVTVALDSDGQPTFTIHRPAAYDCIPARPVDFAPHWICFGTLHQTAPAMRRLTQDLVDAYPRARRFYDVNLRPGCYTPALIAELLPQATVVKLNESEAMELDRMLGPQQWDSACITRGAAGCTIFLNGERTDCPGHPVKVADAVGAGDAFSAAFLHGLDQGWPPPEIGEFANRIAAEAASRHGA
ncbi:MAG TPA: carbohydrate kinase [Candidatus Acidoferrales bacterium]|nr:carbohydrate kinase [Candidatus Acidoferrales bacterium]